MSQWHTWQLISGRRPANAEHQLNHSSFLYAQRSVTEYQIQLRILLLLVYAPVCSCLLRISSTQTTNTSLPLLCCYAEMPRQEQGYQEVLGRYLRQRQGRHQGGVECENRPRSRVSACRVSLSVSSS